MGITYHHGVNLGDLIGSMAGLKAIYQNLGKEAIIYQETNRKAEYYIGATHPIRNDKGVQVTMNKAIFKMAKPLILSQEYVRDFREFKGQKCTIDLDVIHTKLNTNIPYLALPTWPMYGFPDMAYDISKPWISVKRSNIVKGKVIINMTERYRNNSINYFFLKKYENDLIFSGTDNEYGIFCEKAEIKIPYLKIDDFLDLAQCIRGSKFFYGNQSAGWNVANAMGHPRLLEICSFAPNCQPFVGERNFGYYFQNAAEYYFERLFKETK